MFTVRENLRFHHQIADVIEKCSLETTQTHIRSLDGNFCYRTPLLLQSAKMSRELLFILYRCILSVKPSIIFRFRILNLLLWCLQGGVVLGQVRSARDDFSIKHSANTVKPRKDFTTVKNYAYEKFGQVQELSSSSTGWGYGALESEAPTQNFIEDPKKRKMALQGKLDDKYTDYAIPQSVTLPNNQSSREYDDWRDPNDFDQITAHRRLVDELLDPEFYEKTVHPRRNFHEPTRINLSMSLYQILDVDERSQSLVANVWMVQDWFDEFLDWDPV
ncbi:neurotransmitter-gated ion-channel ligand binding domain-containing protein [Ditylenchus destructor]|uniref:Neurotransmitter-gated ion-channel ligand binding domain-containing protein n=1 Tax=Ditylenchus destructor TaxID=166010 RepID=A0AAD4NNK9_9BILA|nr:neurotransmitter-gated ion-channel ligand binding domain-containing protein [Ditylenchus destructor]